MNGTRAASSALQHPSGQLRFGRRHARAFGRDTLLGAAAFVFRGGVGPVPAEVELGVDQSATPAGSVRQVHADLGVLDSTRSSGVLSLHRGGLGALLDVAGLVRDQHRVVGGQGGDRDGAHPVTQSTRVPRGLGQKALQSVRVGVAGGLSELPQVLARHLAEQPARHRPQILPGSRTREHIVHRGAQCIQLPSSSRSWFAVS